MSERERPPEHSKEKTDWRRIGLIATVLLVPGGFLLGGALAARRMRAGALENDLKPTGSEEIKR